MQFTIRLAGVPVAVTALYPETETMCGAYRCEDAPLFRVVSTPALIAQERANALREGTRPSGDAYLETLAVYRQIAEKMVERDVLLFHGSAVAVDGNAYLFTADSGTGKSTHARLWRETLPAPGREVVMVNDDKPLLRFTPEGVLVCGTPWDGKHHLSSNVMVPLRAICFLSRGETNRISPADGRTALQELMKHAFRPAETAHLMRTVALLDRLSREVRLYTLACTMEPEAALIAYEGMRYDG